MSKLKYIIWGSSGHAKVINDVIQSNGGQVIAFIDENPLAHSVISNVPIFIGENGFKKWLSDTDSLENIFYCLHGGLNYEEVEEIMSRAMHGKHKPDAILACSDKITTSVMRYCQLENIAIPNEVGLVGFSNLDLTDLLAPSLTVVRQPAYEMGRIAAELLIKQIESKRPIKDFEDVVIATELHQRASSEKRKA